MKGNIVDIHKEGYGTFRACVLDVIGGNDELATVIDLKTGEVVEVHSYEVSEPIIEDVFSM